jgi:phosphoribosylaminoimidazole carboxylase PurE protein
MAPLVPILMGSKSDLAHAQKVADALTSFGIEWEMRVSSAHKTPQVLLEIVAAYEADPRPKVYVSIAGRSNALSAMLDAQVGAPVIACPPPSDAFGGADVFSSLRMPSGVAPAVVLDPAGAALVAAKIFGVTDPAIRDAVKALQKKNADRLAQEDAEINA